MSAEIHRADWSIPYPKDLDADGIPKVLQPLTYVEHEWDAFPWHLAGNLVNLLEKPEASFEYLHLTEFFRARAAMLALKGCVLDHGDLFGALSKHRVQAGGIYREHLLFHMRGFLGRHKLTQMPDCYVEDGDRVGDADQVEKNRVLLRKVVRYAEMCYLQTLNFISVASSMNEEVAQHSVGFWVRGAEMPQGIDVPVRVRRQNGMMELRPTPEEVKRLIRAGIPLWKILMKMEGEAAEGRRQQTEDRRLKTEDSQRAEGGGQKSEARVDGRPVAEKKHINLATKYKARAFLQFIRERLAKSGVADFYVEEMREAFNAQFSGNLAHRQWKSDRFREDLFRGKEPEFDLLFEPLDTAAGHYRLRG